MGHHSWKVPPQGSQSLDRHHTRGSHNNHHHNRQQQQRSNRKDRPIIDDGASSFSRQPRNKSNNSHKSQRSHHNHEGRGSTNRVHSLNPHATISSAFVLDDNKSMSLFSKASSSSITDSPASSRHISKHSNGGPSMPGTPTGIIYPSITIVERKKSEQHPLSLSRHKGLMIVSVILGLTGLVFMCISYIKTLRPDVSRSLFLIGIIFITLGLCVFFLMLSFLFACRWCVSRLHRDRR